MAIRGFPFYREVAKIVPVGRKRDLDSNILLRGHELPMIMRDDGSIAYLRKREAGIIAWFGDNLDAVTAFNLVEKEIS